MSWPQHPQQPGPRATQLRRAEPCPLLPAVNKAQAVMRVGGKAPALGENVFVAPNASVLGEVKLGAGSSVWYGAVVRGAQGPGRGWAACGTCGRRHGGSVR